MTTNAPTEAQLSRRILIADDDPFYREIAVASLVDAGYDVMSAGNGREAIDLISNSPPDLAIVDVLMPEMSGIDVLIQLRSSASHRHLPVIVITGNDDTESIQQAYDAGATSFLAKPLNWPLFVQHVNFVLKAGQAETDLRDAIRTAEFLSDLKSRVVSVLIGEFQAPLRTAQGMSELLRKEVYGPLGHRIYLEYTEDLHTALEQLNSIQLKMMNSSRMMSAELLLKEEDVPLRHCLIEAIHAMRAKADRRGIDIELRDGVRPDVLLRGDRSLFSQSIKMLLESAIAASPRNIGIQVDARIDSEGAFVLSMQDSGPAMPENMVRDILGTSTAVKPVAQQVVVSRNTSLTISRVVLEAHDGKMQINSTMGEGTVVRLVLPSSRISTGTKSPVPVSGSSATVPPALVAPARAEPPPIRSAVLVPQA
jgi:two-component system sensor histidine kinase/response regulator